MLKDVRTWRNDRDGREDRDGGEENRNDRQNRDEERRTGMRRTGTEDRRTDTCLILSILK